MRLRLFFKAVLLFVATSYASAGVYYCNGVYTDSPGNNCQEIKIQEQKIEAHQYTYTPDRYVNMTSSLSLPTTRTVSYSEGKRVDADLRRVIDGDTIEIKIDGRHERVRYIGIDCPESSQEFGKEATEANKSLLGSSVTLEFDVQERDRYGRLLAYVWYGSTMVNEELVREGYCMMATYPPNVKYVDRFRDAQRYARENKKGVWEKGGLSESPYEYRKRHKRYYSR